MIKVREEQIQKTGGKHKKRKNGKRQTKEKK